jgi:hypothetical protein
VGGAHIIIMASPTPYEDLLALFRSLPQSFDCPSPFTHPRATWRGQVYARRALHRKMCFLSLREETSSPSPSPPSPSPTPSPSSPSPTSPTHPIEVFLSSTLPLLRGGNDTMRALNTLRPGDVISVTGLVQNTGNTHGKPMIVAEEVEVVSVWSERFPGLPFVVHDECARPEGVSGAGATPLPRQDPPAAARDGPGGREGQAPPSPLEAVAAAATSQPAPAAPPAPRAESFYDGNIPLHNLCRYFISTPLGCRKTACPYLHSVEPFLAEGVRDPSLPPFNLGSLKFAWGRWRQHTRALATDHDGGAAARPLPSSDAAAETGVGAGTVSRPPTESCVYHGARAAAFVTWLIEHCPPELLARGVLDVAGGRGDVAAQLTLRAGANVTTVDPKPYKPPHKRMEKVLLKRLGLVTGRKRKGAGLEGEGEETGDDGAEGGGGGGGGAPAPPPPAVPRRADYISAYFGPSFVSDPAHASLLAEVGVLLGFHPDQATEPLLRHALSTGKPVVIVPCCVCGRDFPGRRRLSGEEVNSFEDFVGYLREMPERLRREHAAAVAAADAAGAAAAAPPPRPLPPMPDLAVDHLAYHGANLILHTLPRRG